MCEVLLAKALIVVFVHAFICTCTSCLFVILPLSSRSRNRAASHELGRVGWAPGAFTDCKGWFSLLLIPCSENSNAQSMSNYIATIAFPLSSLAVPNRPSPPLSIFALIRCIFQLDGGFLPPFVRPFLPLLSAIYLSFELCRPLSILDLFHLYTFFAFQTSKLSLNL